MPKEGILTVTKMEELLWDLQNQNVPQDGNINGFCMFFFLKIVAINPHCVVAQNHS